MEFRGERTHAFRRCLASVEKSCNGVARKLYVCNERRCCIRAKGKKEGEEKKNYYGLLILQRFYSPATNISFVSQRNPRVRRVNKRHALVFVLSKIVLASILWTELIFFRDLWRYECSKKNILNKPYSGIVKLLADQCKFPVMKNKISLILPIQSNLLQIKTFERGRFLTSRKISSKKYHRTRS